MMAVEEYPENVYESPINKEDKLQFLRQRIAVVSNEKARLERLLREELGIIDPGDYDG